MALNRQEYIDKVKGCWLGKTIGGTLGAPMEWERAFNNVNFYLQDLRGTPVPNDDLDLQLIWLYALEYFGTGLTAADLGEFFLKFVTPSWAEYGMAKCNLADGILPPYSGIVGNTFKNSCGCYIRSEIWACIAPALPEAAVRYALKDASVDHGWGEGAFAEAFCAAMQASAFAVNDIRELLHIALGYIPANCRCAEAVLLAEKLYGDKLSLHDARDEMIRRFHSGYHVSVSKEDEEKGLGGGEIGEEAPTNLGMIVLALLYGEGDFEKSVCYAVNCGEDTDCTAGTVGALFGILQGASALPEKWTAPIGENIVTMCIAQGEMPVPKTVNELTDRVARIADCVLSENRRRFTFEPSAFTAGEKAALRCADPAPFYRDADGIFYKLGMMNAYVKYPGGMQTSAGEEFTVRFLFENPVNLPVSVEVELLPNAAAQPVGAACKRLILAHDYPHLGSEEFIGRKSVDFRLRAAEDFSGGELVFSVRPQGRAQKFFVTVVVLARTEDGA